MLTTIIILVLALLAGLIVFLILRSHSIKRTLLQIMAAVLLVTGLILVNFIASVFSPSLDMTEQQLYTLSDGSRKLLRKLKDPVTLKFYYSRSLEGIPILFKNYAERIERLLKSYEAASNGMLTVKVIDPRPDSDAEEEARKAGLNGQQLQNYDLLYLGLRAIQADQEEVLPFFLHQREELLEFDISQLIFQVGQIEQPKIGILSSLPVIAQGQPFAQPGQPRPQDWTFVSQLRQTFDVVNITDGNIPDDISVLLVIHPKPANVSPETQFQIDQFLLSGKPVFVAVDPTSYVEQASMGQMAMFGGMGPGQTASNLPVLFGAYGIEFDQSQVVGDAANSLARQFRDGRQAYYPVWVAANNFDTENPVTSVLREMWLIEPGSLALRKGSDLNFTPLVQTSQESGEVDASILQMPTPERVMEALKPDGKPRVLAAMVRGKFKTAFPDGRPKKPEETPEPPGSAPSLPNTGGSGSGGNEEKPSTEVGEGEGSIKEGSSEAEPSSQPGPEGKPDGASSADEPAEKQLLQSETESTLVVVADVDFLADAFVIERFEFLGIRDIRPNPNNNSLAFMLSMIDFLAGSSDLVSLRGKGSTLKPFTVVREMEKKAEKNLQAELKPRLDEVAKLEGERQQMPQQQDQFGRLIPNPEQQKLEEEMKIKITELNREIRMIRKKYREDIERLELQTAGLNILGVPVLLMVALAGFFVVRGARRS